MIRKLNLVKKGRNVRTGFIWLTTGSRGDILKAIKFNLSTLWTCTEGTYLPTYLITYLLTPWSRVFLKKLTSFQLVKKFPAFYATRSSLPHSQEPATCPYPEPARSSPCPPTNSLISILILSSHLRLGLPSVSFPQVSPPKPCIEVQRHSILTSALIESNGQFHANLNVL